jgi:hypothetical protein
MENVDILHGWRKRHELVELPVTSAGGSGVEFPDIPNLRDDTTQDIIILGIDVYAQESMPVMVGSQNPVIPMADLLKCFVTFYVEEEESVRRVPLVRAQPLWQSNTAGALQGGLATLSLECLKFTWNKSFIEFSEAIAQAAPFSFVFGVWYKKLPPGTWEALREAAGYVKGW